MKAARHVFGRVIDRLVQAELDPVKEYEYAYASWGDDEPEPAPDPAEDTNWARQRQDYLWTQVPVCSVGDFDARVFAPNIWHVEHAHKYLFIGRVELDYGAMQWIVKYVPVNSQLVTYTFDYLESSLEAAVKLLVLMHRMDEGEVPW
jgi:hypothetical protein